MSYERKHVPSTVNSPKKIIVDGSNVAWDGVKKNRGEKTKIRNIILMRDELKKHGFTDIEVICDANLYWKIDDPKLYDERIDDNLIIQAPAGNKADEWIIELIKEFNTKVVTKDRFTDIIIKDEWLRKNITDLRVPFMIIDNKIKFINLESKIDYNEPKTDQTIKTQDLKIDENNKLTKDTNNLPQINTNLQINLDHAPKSSREKNQETLFNEGLTLLKEGDFIRAYGLFSQIIHKDQKHTLAYLNRAYANRGLGQLKPAIRD